MTFKLIDIVQHLLNIVVLYVIVRGILYKPVRNFMLKRQERFDKERGDAEAQMETALKMKTEYEACLENARVEVQETINEGINRADSMSQEILDKARQEAQEIVAGGREQMAQEQREALAAMQSDVVSLAIGLASKIMEREISAKDNQMIIEQFFSEVS